MKIKKEFIIAVLAVLCLAVTLFVTLPIESQTGAYDPWVDVNDDGSIDMADISIAIEDFMTSGTPMTKAGLLYDSEWIDVSDKAGQYFDVVHNLNSADIIVDVTGKTTADGGVHQKYIGGTDLAAGWNKTYGGTGNDLEYSIAQTNDGGYVLAGTTNSFGAGLTDSWLVRTDASGNEQWNKTYGGTGNDYAYSVVQTTDGGYAMAGQTYSYGPGDSAAYLVKTDSAGTMLWNKTYGETGSNEGRSLVQTEDGGYAFAGGTSRLSGGFWLVKTDASGNEQWNKTYGGSLARSVVQTSDRGYAIAGYTNAFGAGTYDFWLVKTDADGNHLWNATYGGIDYDLASSVVQASDGGYAIAGYTNSSGAGNDDFWLVKTDTSGNEQWNKTYGGTSVDRANSVIQTSDGGYALVGGYVADLWLVKTGPAGNMQWNKTYGGTILLGLGTSVVQTSDGGYALGGRTFEPVNFDFWLVKTDAAGNPLDGFRYGLAWVGSTANSVTLYRGTDDAYWNYVRVRVWKVKESP